MKIVFTGGGTGGHLMPIIAISRELKSLYKKDDLTIYYLGPKDDFALLSGEHIKTYPIASGKIRRYFSFQNIVDVLFKIPFSFLQSFFWLLVIRPQLVFSKGGTGSLPVAYCASILRLPLFIHESDMAAGLSNKMASAWAKKVFVSFEKTQQLNPAAVTLVVGNPIRRELLGGSKEEAKKILGLAFEKPVILILGGSQGAEPINDFVLLVLHDLLQKYEVIHVAGAKNYKNVYRQTSIILAAENSDLEKRYHVYPFLNEVELKSAYVASSLVISRSGSGSIFEIAALGKPSILIPLPSSANDHQSKNAYQYVNSGACMVIEQGSLSPNFFLGEIENILLQSKKMEKAALAFSKPDAATTIVKAILDFLNNNATKK